MTVEALLDSIRQLHQDVLGQLLIGCYVHGSLALDCFQWNRSDIDFLTLVHAQPSPAQKEALIAGLLRLEPSAPPRAWKQAYYARMPACLFSIQRRLSSIIPGCTVPKPRGIWQDIAKPCMVWTKIWPLTSP